MKTEQPTTEAGSIEPPECKYCGKAIFSEREACDVCMPVPTGPVALTLQQKLNALGARFYSHLQWTPKAGDYYTSSRADLELYRVVKIEDGTVYTEYCTSPGNLADWPEGDFTTKGFGLQRVWVPDWVLQIKQSPEPPAEQVGDMDLGALYRHCEKDPAVYSILRRLVQKGVAPEPRSPFDSPVPHGVIFDRVGWVCSMCGGWNHQRDKRCTHTHGSPETKEGGSNG